MLCATLQFHIATTCFMMTPCHFYLLIWTQRQPRKVWRLFVSFFFQSRFLATKKLHGCFLSTVNGSKELQCNTCSFCCAQIYIFQQNKFDGFTLHVRQKNCCIQWFQRSRNSQDNWNIMKHVSLCYMILHIYMYSLQSYTSLITGCSLFWKNITLICNIWSSIFLGWSGLCMLCVVSSGVLVVLIYSFQSV